MKQKKQPHALSRLTLILFSSILALWGFLMCVVTYTQAVTIRNLALSNVQSNTDNLSSHNYDSLKWVVESDMDQEQKEIYYLHQLHETVFSMSFDFNEFSSSFLPEGAHDKIVWAEEIEGERFVAAFDASGTLIAKQESCITFSYDNENGGSPHRAAILLPEDFPEPELYAGHSGQFYNDWVNHGQLTGWFEYGYFIPTKIVRTDTIDYSPHTVYERRLPVTSDAEIITIDSSYFINIKYDFGTSPVSYEDKHFSDLEELAVEFAAQRALNNGDTKLAHYGLATLVYLDYSNIPALDGGYNTLVYVARCSPLLTAMKAMLKVYIISFLAAIILVLALRSLIRNQLIEPIARVNRAFENKWDELFHLEDYWSGWLESTDLVRNYSLTQDQFRMQQNEINRLNTALEYAKDAEQNRRQMVSNIAHEFKTPLAVIHSYAEGLNEHIAEGKREKYLNVILSESDRLDSMVLELLDLSRLEAGKVKLARDEFDLAQLVHSVFEHLEMAAQAKELIVEFHFPDHCTVTADESRLRQVIENFASNAVKYTPAGGKIRASITTQTFRTRSDTVSFSIENDSPPLSTEALSKVWETFYRTDDARSGSGTGLGLAIAKNIVELHGGKCAVENTENGVKFQFTI